MPDAPGAQAGEEGPALPVNGPSWMRSLPLPQQCCPRSPAVHAALPPMLQSCPPDLHCPFLLCCLGTSTRLAGQADSLWHQLT